MSDTSTMTARERLQQIIFETDTPAGKAFDVCLQILIVLKAFQDSVLQGILCLLIPGYSFVYLFFMSDDFYARAVLGGLLIGMAKDSYLFYEQYALTLYNAINAWLASGG